MSYVSSLEMKLNEYFYKKAPALPTGIKEFIVWIAPYLTILGIIFMVPAVFALLGIGALFAPAIIAAGGIGFAGAISLLALVATIVLDVMAVPGLFSKKKEAWDKMFYVSLINVVVSLLGGHWFSLIIGALISWYILFQIRPSYK